MNNITTLENVFQRVDTMFQTCHDSLIPVKDISFDDLDTIKIAGSTHPLKTHCTEIDRLALGNSIQLPEKMPSRRFSPSR